MTPAGTIAVEGLVARTEPLTLERLLDVAFTDEEGRVLVAMIDVFALLRLDSRAEILLVRHTCGRHRALQVSETIREDDLFLYLQVRESIVSGRCQVVPRLWDRRNGPSTAVASLVALTFSAFVGRS